MSILAPFSWLLLALYNVFESYGLALILFSLVIKLVLLPFGMKSKKSMMRMTRINPKMKEIQKKYANNKEKYNEEIQKLYAEEKINPLGGCLWSLIPFPILLGLYSVIRQPLTNLMSLSKEQIVRIGEILGIPASNSAYSEITLAQQVFLNYDKIAKEIPQVLKIDFTFLGINLAEIPNWKAIFDSGVWTSPNPWAQIGLFLIPVLSAATALLTPLITQKMMKQPMEGSAKSMLYMMPLISLYIGFIMPAGIGVYWIANSVFSLIQEVILTKHYMKVLDAEDAVNRNEKQRREAELERKRAETQKRKELEGNVRDQNTSKKKIQNLEKKKTTEAGAKNKEPKSGAVGDRPYARGRAYDPDRFNKKNEDILYQNPSEYEALEEKPDEATVFESEPETDALADNEMTEEASKDDNNDE